MHAQIDAIARQETELQNGAPASDEGGPGGKLLPVAMGKEELVALKEKKRGKGKSGGKKSAKKGGRGIRRIAKEALKKSKK